MNARLAVIEHMARAFYAAEDGSLEEWDAGRTDPLLYVDYRACAAAALDSVPAELLREYARHGRHLASV